MTIPIDHKELAISRLATQYKESENLIGYIESLLVESNTLEETLFEVLNERWLDIAVGRQLDILGEIVNQSRIQIDADTTPYFGFDPYPPSKSFGTLQDVAIGGRFRRALEASTGFRRLTDDEYRLFIRARISRNVTRSTPEDVIAQVRQIFGSPLVLFEDGDTYYTVSIGRKLTLNEKAFLFTYDIIPKTAGVKAFYITEFNTDDFFGFSGVTGSAGFGSINNSSLGGEFGNLIF